MKYELIIKEEASLEIIESYLFYESKSIGLGERFLNNLDVYFDRIQDFPEHYQIKRKPYREAFVKKFPFVIVYEILENETVIYAVFHSSRNPKEKPQTL
ncbi:type II toxin-antitoxin system RelE/ParE family toxin [Flavobacterium sp.]|uniref:type II toxin-antitoxin system RelE/ParE family toxin n=1 Tax=Flavobacterium sp. TaxID=239 RepID=UPI003752B554